MRIRLATRGSVLALRQTEWVAQAIISRLPNVEIETVEASTAGDADKTTPLTVLGQGVFVKGVEALLIAGAADAAVHSLKDVPTNLTPNLELASYPVREDPRDALVASSSLAPSVRDAGLDGLPRGARVGTGSPRRAAQLRSRRPDLTILPIRGNLDSRISKLRDGAYDGIVVAVAGVARLGRTDELDWVLDPSECTPAAGQGALVIQCRLDDDLTRAIVVAIDDPTCRVEVDAERAFLAALGGGCQLPAGALATARDGKMDLLGVVASTDGRRLARDCESDGLDGGARLGAALARRLMPRAERLAASGTAG